jgi:hypothetical protein
MEALGVVNILARRKKAAARSSSLRMRHHVMNAECYFDVCRDWPSEVRDGRMQDGARSMSALRALSPVAVEDVYLECVVLQISGVCEPVQNGA